MKRIYVLLISSLATVYGYGQTAGHTQTTSGFSNTCEFEKDAATPLVFLWAFYGPTCDFSATNGGGGVDESAVNEISLGWGSGGTGTVGKMYCIFELISTVNLSANPRIRFKATSMINAAPGGGQTTPANLTYVLKLQDASNADLLDDMINVAMTTSEATFDLDLTGHIASGKDLTAVKKVIFFYDNCSASNGIAGSFKIKELEGGSLVLSGGLKDAAALKLNSTGVYPNPAQGQVNLSYVLEESALVNISLSDLAGKTNVQLFEGVQSVGEQELTANLTGVQKGMYMVNYSVDGRIVKSSPLVVTE